MPLLGREAGEAELGEGVATSRLEEEKTSESLESESEREVTFSPLTKSSWVAKHESGFWEGEGIEGKLGIA